MEQPIAPEPPVRVLPDGVLADGLRARRDAPTWWPHSTFFELHPPRATQPVIKAERVIDRMAAQTAEDQAAA